MQTQRGNLSVALIGGLLGSSFPAHAREMLNLAPTSKWVLDYADENCRLARSFGTGDEQVNMVLDQFSPGDWFRVTLTGRPLTISNLKIPAKPLIRFGPNEKPSEADGFAALIGETPAFISSGSLRLAPFTEVESKAAEVAARSGQEFDPEPIGKAREAAAKWIELTDLFRRADIRLESGPLDKPFEAMRQCSWDTVRSWGLDVAQQKSLSRKPKARGTAASWFSPDDYPSKMLDRNKQAMVNVRVIVDEKGAPATCTIQRSTHPKDFDDLVCRLILKRARFEPALDASGNPVRSFYTQRVTWRLE